MGKKSGSGTLIGQKSRFREGFRPRRAAFSEFRARIWGCRGSNFVDLFKVGAKITGGNGIPAGSGSFVAPLGGIRRDLGFYGAKFAESLSDSTIWRAAELKLVDLVKTRQRLLAEIAFDGGS